MHIQMTFILTLFGSFQFLLPSSDLLLLPGGTQSYSRAD
jgi:hypothetical protein